MQVSFEALEFILRILQILVIPVLGWLIKVLWNLRKDVLVITQRVKKNEELLECAPNHDAIHGLALAIEGLRGDVRTVNEKVGGMANLVNKLDSIIERQESYLLNNGGK